MGDERLLERIHNMEMDPESRIERNTARKINSIIYHLQRLLNSHQGSTLTAEDYGIPDITNTHGESITEISRRIERTLQEVIMKYEPRLTKVKVSTISHMDDVLSLRFKLEAVLVTDNATPVVLETVVSSEGKVNISS
ncbi:MAG: type VI secretion system baseplate subunit TssE [Candidatus Latescibacteria bacterium]|nr:type VI secretion system baseplate subunit TssE [Candidatus Latescibacterota bacterium]